MATELALQKALRVWRTEKTCGIGMDIRIAEAFADILDKYIEALRWCSGSADFNPGGKAFLGWEKICAPLLKQD